MALFKYYPPKRVSVFASNMVRFSPGSEFNDPFDGVPVLRNFNSPELVRQRYETLMARQYQTHLSQHPLPPVTFSQFKQTYTIEQFIKFLEKNYEKYRRHFFSDFEKLRQTIGVLCLCRNGESAAMWAHYGQNQAGFMVEFDEAHEFIQAFHDPKRGQWIEMQYSDARPIWDYARGDGDDSFSVKSREWHYEQEVRLLRF